MNLEELKKYKFIACDPHILGGKPVIVGTRLSVAQILRCLSHGMSVDDIREMYGNFPDGAITELLQFASTIVDQEKFDVAS